MAVATSGSDPRTSPMAARLANRSANHAYHPHPRNDPAPWRLLGPRPRSGAIIGTAGGIPEGSSGLLRLLEPGLKDTAGSGTHGPGGTEYRLHGRHGAG